MTSLIILDGSFGLMLIHIGFILKIGYSEHFMFQMEVLDLGH